MSFSHLSFYRNPFALPEPRLHPLGRLIVFALGALLMQVAVSLVIGAALATAATVSKQPMAEVARDFFSKFALWLNLILYPPLYLWLWFCRGTLDRRSLASLGLRTSNGFKLFSIGALSGAAAIAFLFGVLWLARQVAINGASPEAFDTGLIRITVSLLAYAGLFYLVAFMEELLFRGYLLHNVAAFASQRMAIWVQAIAFAMIHMGNVGMQSQSAGADAEAMQAATLDSLRAMPSLVLVGAVFALMYLKTGSLWFPIGFHAAWNFFLGCVFSLPVSGISIFRLMDVSVSPNAWLTGGAFGAEGSVLLLPILAAMWWLLSTQPDHPQVRLDLAVLRPETIEAMNIEIEPLPEVELLEPPTSLANENTGVETNAEDAAPHQSRFKTSMRSQDADVISPPVVWGQLPRPESASLAPEAPSAPPIMAPSTTPVTAPAPTSLLPQQTLVPAAPSPAPAVTPPELNREEPARPTSEASSPTPRKPAPRW
ncbi:MAG: protease family protein [Abditibacteriota bacterium]|nr:protease family protein [Abditibacteriota bacterium]